MSKQFREDKTTQAAGVLLKREGGKMNYMKLLKLLYLADRKAIELWELPITFDLYVSMDNGPVLSSTYDLIAWGSRPGMASYWSEFISGPTFYNVSLLLEPETNKLSEAEIQALDAVYDQYGKFSQWDLVTITHKLPEYKDPNGSAIPIPVHDILVALGEDTEDVARIEKEIQAEIYFNALLDC